MNNLRLLITMGLVLLSASAASPTVAFAQEGADEGCSGAALVCWLQENDFVIRESFSNAAKSSKPAVISFVDPNEGTDHYRVDLALARKFGLLENEDFFFFPSLEWHRSTEDDQDFNKLRGALSFEYYVGGGESGNEEKTLKMFTLGQVGAERDLQEDATTGLASVLVAPYKEEGWSPGNLIRGKHDALIGRYYPLIGLEYYENLALPDDEGKLSKAFGVARLQIEWFPFNRSKLLSGAFFQVNLVYTMRYAWSNDELIDRHFDLWEIGADFFLDEARRVAIGVNYESGRNPKNSFDSRTSTVIALKFQIGEAL